MFLQELRKAPSWSSARWTSVLQLSGQRGPTAGCGRADGQSHYPQLERGTPPRFSRARPYGQTADGAGGEDEEAARGWWEIGRGIKKNVPELDVRHVASSSVFYSFESSEDVDQEPHCKEIRRLISRLINDDRFNFKREQEFNFSRKKRGWIQCVSREASFN